MWRIFRRFLSKKNDEAAADNGTAAGGAHNSTVQSVRSLTAVVAQDGVFSNIAAELRSPLTLILAPLESLLMGEQGALNDKQKRLLHLVHKNSVKLLQMVSGLLDFSKLEAGTLEVHRQPVNVTNLVTAIINDFQPLAERKNVVLAVECVPENAVVSIDRYLFERIVFNLVSNGVKFTPGDGRVDVRLQSQDERIILEVSDTGLGIADEELPEIFKEFHRLHGGSTRRTEGIGLGLALVREFAGLLGGCVTVESALGKGSTFRVELTAPSTAAPVVNPSCTAPGAQLLRQFEAVLPSSDKSRSKNRCLPKVLIADNNAELAGYVAELLNELCVSKIATDGEKALELVHEWRPDLVLTAVILPKMDGLSLCRAVKGKPETAMTSVVLLTSLTQREAMLQGWDAGADEYLFKPFHPAELVTRVRSLLRSMQQRKRAQEQIEGLNEALERRVIELAAANNELKSLATKLEQARDQALEGSRFKSVFLANMSHEIRTPINGVISMSDMLMRTPLSGEQSEIAGIIRDSAGALLDIINDILDFSKIEAGKLELEIVDFELRTMIEGTAELVAEQARHKRLSLMTHIASDIPQVLRGDPGRLRQILLNLLSNAIKFTNEGEVVVQTTLDAKDGQLCRIRVSVTDTGIGMAQDAVHRLFQPFTQADGSITRKFGGTGLGLSIAKLLVELLGGRIGVRSTEGSGSTFWFSVPLERACSSKAAEESFCKRAMENTRILIVEPLPGTAEILRQYCQSWGMQAEHVLSVTEALQALRQANGRREPFDVVIVEQQQVQDEEGFSLAESIRRDRELGGTRLILCTASDEERLGERALQSGFCAYLLKPVKQSRLYDCLALVLDRSDQVAHLNQLREAQRAAAVTAEIPAFNETGIILVAEDNPVNQKVALLLLKELGFAAHVVANGREAIDAVTRAPYSLILMDCQMPDVDGFEATGAIRRAETLTGRHIPIIAMTAHAMQGDREKCIAAGMDDYVSKPVTAAKLKQILVRWFKPDSQNWRTISEPGPSLQHEGVTKMSSPASQDSSFSDPGPLPSNDQEIINLGGLENSCGVEGARELLQIFVESTSELFERMKLALDQKNSKQLKANAHEMKGACASVGANPMALAAKTLEQQALAEDWPGAAITCAELKKLFDKVSAYCQRILHDTAK